MAFWLSHCLNLVYWHVLQNHSLIKSTYVVTIHFHSRFIDSDHNVLTFTHDTNISGYILHINLRHEWNQSVMFGIFGILNKVYLHKVSEGGVKGSVGLKRLHSWVCRAAVDADRAKHTGSCFKCNTLPIDLHISQTADKRWGHRDSALLRCPCV